MIETCTGVFGSVAPSGVPAASGATFDWATLGRFVVFDDAATRGRALRGDQRAGDTDAECTCNHPPSGEAGNRMCVGPWGLVPP